MSAEDGFTVVDRRRGNKFMPGPTARSNEDVIYQVLGPKAGQKQVNTCLINLAPVRGALGYPTERQISDFIMSSQLGLKMADIASIASQREIGEVWVTMKTDEKCMELEERLLKGVLWQARAASDVVLFGQRMDEPTLQVTIVGVPAEIPEREIRRIMTKYGKVGRVSRGTHMLAMGKQEDDPEWIWDGRWVIHIKVKEEETLPSYIMTGQDHWRLHFRGSIQACFKCLSTDHKQWRCNAKPRGDSNITWVPYMGLHVDAVDPITEADLEDGVDYDELATQRTEAEKVIGRGGPGTPRRRETGNGSQKLREKVGQQEELIAKLQGEIAARNDQQERMENQDKTIKDLTEKMMKMGQHNELVVKELTDKLVKLKAKRGRGESVEENNGGNAKKLNLMEQLGDSLDREAERQAAGNGENKELPSGSEMGSDTESEEEEESQDDKNNESSVEGENNGKEDESKLDETVNVPPLVVEESQEQPKIPNPPGAGPDTQENSSQAGQSGGSVQPSQVSQEGQDNKEEESQVSQVSHLSPDDMFASTPIGLPGAQVKTVKEVRKRIANKKKKNEKKNKVVSQVVPESQS